MVAVPFRKFKIFIVMTLDEIRKIVPGSSKMLDIHALGFTLPGHL